MCNLIFRWFRLPVGIRISDMLHFVLLCPIPYKSFFDHLLNDFSEWRPRFFFGFCFSSFPFFPPWNLNRLFLNYGVCNLVRK